MLGFCRLGLCLRTTSKVCTHSNTTEGDDAIEIGGDAAQ